MDKKRSTQISDEAYGKAEEHTRIFLHAYILQPSPGILHTFEDDPNNRTVNQNTYQP